jgi:hypothetical protein
MSSAHPSVSSAQIHPHPQRLLPHQLPLQPRQPVSLFEKSNVLVMYVNKTFIIWKCVVLTQVLIAAEDPRDRARPYSRVHLHA